MKMVEEDLRPSKILTLQAFENAICANMAIGGSTNAIIHLVAIAGRLGIDLPLEKFDEISRSTPYITNIRPSGTFLMEDLYYAGGVPVVLKEIRALLNLDALTVTGKTMAESIASAQCFNRDVIRIVENPLQKGGWHGHFDRESCAAGRSRQAVGRFASLAETQGSRCGV